MPIQHATAACKHWGEQSSHQRCVLSHKQVAALHGADKALRGQDMMKALMCFMYELAPPVWQRLVCCSSFSPMSLLATTSQAHTSLQAGGWMLRVLSSCPGWHCVLSGDTHKVQAVLEA